MRLACLAVFAVTLTFLAPQPARTVAPDRFAPLQEGARQIIRPELPGSVIRGRVVAGDTGLPVPDAAVALVTLGSLSPGTARDVAVPGPQSNIIVDSAGRFEIGGVAPGLYRLVASPGSTAAQYLTGRLPDPRFDDPPVLALFGQELIAGIGSLAPP